MDENTSSAAADNSIDADGQKNEVASLEPAQLLGAESADKSAEDSAEVLKEAPEVHKSKLDSLLTVADTFAGSAMVEDLITRYLKDEVKKRAIMGAIRVYRDVREAQLGSGAALGRVHD
jgi:hypothetical protein